MTENLEKQPELGPQEALAPNTKAQPAHSQTHTPEILLCQRKLTQQDDRMCLTLLVRVFCPHFCDLTGSKVRIQNSLGDEWEVELSAFNGVENDSAEFNVMTDAVPDVYWWSASYAENEGDKKGIKHVEVSHTLSFDYRPHTISLAVWGMPFPAIAGERVNVKVGARCNNDCTLEGLPIRIQNEQNEVVASSVLGSDFWPSSKGLYWTDLNFEVPNEAKSYTYTALIDASEKHETAETKLSFLASPMPQHKLEVVVIDRNTKKAIPSATVSLHPYVVRSDDAGKAIIMAAETEGELRVQADNYEEEIRYMMVDKDFETTIALEEKPENLGDF